MILFCSHLLAVAMSMEGGLGIVQDPGAPRTTVHQNDVGDESQHDGSSERWGRMLRSVREWRRSPPQTIEFENKFRAIADEETLRQAKEMIGFPWSKIERLADPLVERYGDKRVPLEYERKRIAAELFWSGGLIAIFSDEAGDRFLLESLGSYVGDELGGDSLPSDVACRICRLIGFSSVNAPTHPKVNSDDLMELLLCIAEDKAEPHSLRVEACLALSKSLFHKYTESKDRFIGRAGSAAAQILLEIHPAIEPDAPESRSTGENQVSVDVGSIRRWTFFPTSKQYRDPPKTVHRTSLRSVGNNYIVYLKRLAEFKPRYLLFWIAVYFGILLLAIFLACLAVFVLRLRKISHRIERASSA